MKITKQQIALVLKTLDACKRAGINQVILEDSMIRGASEDMTVLIFHRDEDVLADFPTIGVGDVANLLDRINLVGIQATFDATIQDDANLNQRVVKNWTMSDGGITVGYRFAHPQTIKAPKSFKNMEILTELNPFSEEQLTNLSKATKIMRADKFNLVCEEGTVRVIVRDIGEEEIVITCGTDNTLPEFDFMFASNILPLLMRAESWRLTTGGILQFTLEGLWFSVIRLTTL